MKYEKRQTRSKGIALLIILVLVATIAIVGLGFIVRGDTELLCGQNMELKADMDYLAESGLEQAKGLIMYPHDLADEYFTGASAQQLVSGNDYYDVSVTKLSELNWQITSSAYRRVGGVNAAQSSFTANMRLDPDVGFWSGAAVMLYQGMNIAGDAYCNGAVKNNGVLNGDCFADSLSGNAITGQIKAKTALQLNKPDITCNLLTSNFSTQTIIANNLNNITLGSPYQVFYKNGDLAILSNVTINGCLAVNGNLTITGTTNVITAAKNTPAIYISGNLIIKEGASITATGLVSADGRIETPIYNTSASITGVLFTDDGIRYIISDYSGSGYDGIVNGDCTWVDGILNGAVNFDGDGDFVDIGNPSELNINKKISVMAYIKVNAFDRSYQAIVTKGNSSWRLQRYANTNYIEFTCSGTYGGSIHSSISVNDGLWHHVAGVRDDSRIRLYIDGVLDTWQFTAGEFNTNSYPVYIGENSEQTGRYFNGAIDSVRIYKRALSASDVWNVVYGIGSTSEIVGFWYMNGGNCSTTVTAAPVKAAVYHWPGGVKDRWSPAAGAFYKTITRNP
ncbi:MAG: LamG domain-containing protein [Phycisphaerae bacterium]|jgi:hypothetical protein